MQMRMQVPNAVQGGIAAAARLGGLGACAPYTADTAAAWLACMQAEGWNVSSVTQTGPPIVSTPAPAAASACQAGWKQDAAGVCVKYADADLLYGLNSIQWDGSAIPVEQVNRIDPQVMTSYKQYTAINPGSVLAYILGLGGSASQGAHVTGSDGLSYTFNLGKWVLTGATQSQTANPNQLNQAPVLDGSDGAGSTSLYIAVAAAIGLYLFNR